MENEKNQTTENVKVHDIVAIWHNQRTGPDGAKLGYDFYCKKPKIGLVTEVSNTKIAMIAPDRDEESYDSEEQNKDYYFTIGQASEFEYQSQIEAKIESLVKARDEKNEEIKKLTLWRHDFENSISFFGRMARFIKGFNA